MKNNKNHNNNKKPAVLIVEDDISINNAYSVKFMREGVAVKIASDGEEAIEMLKKEEPPSLILLDLLLPKKDGFKVLEEIKQDPRLKNIPVIILTNLPREMDERGRITFTAREYLIKSDLSIDEVVKKAKQYLLVK